MATDKIEKLNDLLRTHLGPEKIVIGQETSRLTAPGENYGSTILGVKIRIKTENGAEEILNAVAKLPPTNGFLQKMFNTQVTFRSEIDFYNVLIPILRKFAAESCAAVDFNFFPECYGARLNLDENNVIRVDNNAVLLLENLKFAGYECVERTVGFDLETTKMILINLAQLHAVPLAMKLQKPEDFAEKIKAKFKEFHVFQLGAEIGKFTLDKFMKIIEDIENCKPLLNNVRQALERDAKFMGLSSNNPLLIQEPFATIIHTDAWVNNFMIQFSNNKPLKVKIVDFQLYQYGSPARDLLFFLLTSVQGPVIKKFFHEFIDTYYQAFIAILKKFDCNVKEFSRECFDKEIDFVVNRQVLFHCFVMLEPVFAVKEHIKGLDEINEEHFKQLRPVSKLHKERAALIVQIFHENKWI